VYFSSEALAEGWKKKISGYQIRTATADVVGNYADPSAKPLSPIVQINMHQEQILVLSGVLLSLLSAH